MGKKKQREPETKRKATEEPGSKKLRTEVVMSDAGASTIRETQVLPAVQALSSASPAERAGAVSKIGMLLKDDTSRLLVLKERVTQKLMEETLNDSSYEVVVGTWGALRIVAEEEGFGHCINMYKNGILKQVSAAISKLSSAIESVASNPAALDDGAKKLLWPFADNVVGLLTCLSETTPEVLDAITELESIPFLMGLLKPAAGAPEDVQTTVVRCLQAISDENGAVMKAIVENEGYVRQLLDLKDKTDNRNCLKRVYICGVLHNISLAESDTDHGVSDAAILPVLTEVIKSVKSMELGSYSPETAGKEDLERVHACSIAMEVLASVGTAIGYELDMRLKTEPAGDDDDTDAMEEDDDDDEEKEIGDMLADMDGVTADDHDEVSLSLSGSAEDIMRFLIETTCPNLISLSQLQPIAVLNLRLRALGALNNVAWTVDAAVPADTSLWRRWEKLSHDIWGSVVSPVLAGNTADIELAEAVTSLGWAVAKPARGEVSVDNGQHRAFISLYQAASTDELRTKCVGVLGCLALPQGRVEVNQEIGVFLVTLIGGAPDGPAEPTVEALNALFDIYADKGFDYDEPVFVKNNFLAHLTAALPKVRKMIRRIDKLKFEELRSRAEEAGNNLQRFVTYKKKERAQSEDEASK